MNKDTGEIRSLDVDEMFKEIGDKWVAVPPIGTEIEFTFKQRLKGGVNTTRRRRAKVVEIREGTPGRLVIEMLPLKGN